MTLSNTDRPACATRPRAPRSRDRNVVSVRDGREVTPTGAVGEIGGGSHLERETRLADPAEAHDRHHPMRRDRGADGLDVVAPADELVIDKRQRPRAHVHACARNDAGEPGASGDTPTFAKT